MRACDLIYILNPNNEVAHARTHTHARADYLSL